MKPSLARAMLLAVVLVFTATVRAADDDAFFPIMAWNHAPPDAAVLKKMRECGLTMAGFVSPKDLDLVHAAGMKGIVSDPRTSNYQWEGTVDAAQARKNVESLIAEVGNHPAVFGYYIRDEPQAGWFENLEKVASVVREKAPGKWPYVNLFPIYAEDWQLAAPGYETYLQKFVDTCKPPVLSYDNYSIMGDGSLRPGYWKNLEQMRAAAVKAKIPFWNIVLANAHFDYAEPSPASLRFQAYTTLAYGGRGISYFTYFAPKVGNYRMAPIDQFDNETPTWLYLQNVNNQILKLAPTILKLTSDDVYHFRDVPDGAHTPAAKTLLTDAAGNMMAGDFTHADGSRWVMVVNRDLVKPHPCQPKYRTAPKSVKLLSPYTGDLVAFEGEQVWLAPGQGALLKLEN